MAEFAWVPEDAAGNDLPRSPTFRTREDAEAWMGREWEALLVAGAERVRLVGDGAVVYRMGLREE